MFAEISQRHTRVATGVLTGNSDIVGLQHLFHEQGPGRFAEHAARRAREVVTIQHSLHACVAIQVAVGTCVDPPTPYIQAHRAFCVLPDGVWYLHICAAVCQWRELLTFFFIGKFFFLHCNFHNTKRNTYVQKLSFLKLV